MNIIITQVQALTTEADEAGRIEIPKALQDLQYRVELPKATFMRFTMPSVVVCLLNIHALSFHFKFIAMAAPNFHSQDLELAVIYVGIDLGLLFAQFSEKTGDLPTFSVINSASLSCAVLNSNFRVERILDTSRRLPHTQ